MQRGWALIAVIVLILNWFPRLAHAQEPAALVIAAETRYRGNVTTFDRPIIILGEVDGDVTSWSGTITVRGIVRGDVISYTGPIELARGAVVEGHVLSVAGGVTVEAASDLQGAVIDLEPLAGSALATALIGAISGQSSSRRWLLPGAGGLIGALMTTLLSVALALIWPRRTAGIGRALRAAPLRSAFVGFLSTVLLALFVPWLFAALTLSLVGLALFLPLLIALHLPYLIGFVGVARAIAASWPPGWGLKPPIAAGLGAVMILTPLLVLGIAAPWLAVAIGYMIAAWGLGAALISRGGAMPVWRELGLPG